MSLILLALCGYHVLLKFRGFSSKVSWIFLCASFIDNILRFNVIENLRFLILSFAISLQELGMQSIDVYKHYEMKVSSKL